MVGTVHAQLVRASRDGREGDELMPVDDLKQAEAGDGGLAMHKVDELSRTVIEALCASRVRAMRSSPLVSMSSR